MCIFGTEKICFSRVTKYFRLRTSTPQTPKRLQRARWRAQEEPKERNKLTRAQKIPQITNFWQKCHFWLPEKLKDDSSRLHVTYQHHCVVWRTYLEDGMWSQIHPCWPGPFQTVTNKPSWLAWLAFLYVSCSHTKYLLHHRICLQVLKRQTSQGAASSPTDCPLHPTPLPSPPHLLFHNTWKPIWGLKISVPQKKPIFVLQSFLSYSVSGFKT